MTIITTTACTPSTDPLRKFFGSYRNYTNVNGKIVNGRYYEPYERFSVEVPKLLIPGRIIDGKFIESGGTIVFRDDLGALVRIDLIAATDEESKKIFDQKNWKELSVKVQNYFLNIYKETVPDSKIIYQKNMVWNNKDINTFTVDMKGGGALVDGFGKRDDSLRTSILFIHKNSVYLISTQPSILLRHDRDSDNIKGRIEYLKKIFDTMILN